MSERFGSVDEVSSRLREVDYLADPAIAGVVYLADRLGISLGKANYCLQALIRLGQVKARNFRNNHQKTMTNRIAR